MIGGHSKIAKHFAGDKLADWGMSARSRKAGTTYSRFGESLFIRALDLGVQ